MTVSGWQECTLGELLEIKHGYAFKGEFFGSIGTHVVLTPGNFLDEGGFKNKGDEEKWYGGPIPLEYVLEKGDIVVAMTEQAEGLLGSSAIIPASGLYLHNQRIGLVKLRPDLSPAPLFIYYLFNTRAVRAQIRASASGAKIRHTAPSRIADVRVWVPTPTEQHRVAGILAAYDGLLENNLRRISILEEMARAIYREWFVHLRFPGHEEVTIEDSQLGRAPKRWTARFGDLVTIERDGLDPGDFPEETFEHFSIPAFDDGRLPVLELGAAVRSNKYAVTDGCILLSKLNPRIPRVWLVRPSGEYRAIASTEFLVMKPRREELRTFVYVSCLDEAFQGRFASLAVGTSTSHQRVKPQDFVGMAALMPAGNVLAAFRRLVEPLFDLVTVLRRRNANLRATCDLLLPRLMSGRLSLAEAEAAVS
jgi:type I restriction enzyme S subunit